MTTTPAPKGADIEQAERALKCGEDFAYDTPGPAKDWAHAAARGILYDLSDRRGIKHGFRDVAADVRDEITASLADIIRAAARSSTSTSQGAAPGEVASAGLAPESAETRMDTGFAPGAGFDSGAAPEDALDAARWRFRKQFLESDGAIMFTRSSCQLRRAGELVADGATEQDAIDAAIDASTSKGEGK